jgi:hypothetical protein
LGRVSLAKRCVALAQEQLARAQQNYGLALAGLTEIETELATRGVSGTGAE